jgi:PAS domain S-box-containing protein
MIGLLFAESIGLVLFSFGEGNGWLHSMAHAAALAPLGVIALMIEDRRRAASVLVSLGLVTACALLVHIWHGQTEAHFMFFVTIVVLALYEDWVPFLVAAAYVIVHHGLMGAIDPGGVYDHQDAVDHPWKWALIHGGFVIAAGIASVAAWRLNEGVRAEAERSFLRASESEDRFKGAFEGAPIGMILFSFTADHTGGVSQVNEAMREITGHSREHLETTSMRDVVHPDDASIVQAAVDRLSTGQDERPQFEIRYIHADGHTVWVSVSLSVLRLEADQRGGTGIAQIQDVTESKLASEELAYQALHDPLTGLGNRRSLLADLGNRLDAATLERPLLLQLFDLDGFKTYNDTFGHPAGDSLLTRMAHRLQTGLAEHASTAWAATSSACSASPPATPTTRSRGLRSRR